MIAVGDWVLFFAISARAFGEIVKVVSPSELVDAREKLDVVTDRMVI